MGKENSTVMVNAGNSHKMKKNLRTKLGFNSVGVVDSFKIPTVPFSASDVNFLGSGFKFQDRIDGLDVYKAGSLQDAEYTWREFERRAISTPFQNFDWIENWFDHIASKASLEPLLLFVAHGNRLVMIVPFAVRRSGRTTSLVWFGQPVNDYNAPLIDPVWLAETTPATVKIFWNNLINSLGNIDWIDLQKQPTYIQSHKNPLVNYKSMSFSSSAHFVELEKNWIKLYESLRGAKSRRRLKGKQNKLRSEGKLSFRSVRGQSEQDQFINQILGWKSAQLSDRGAPNPFSNGAFERLFAAINKSPAKNTSLRTYGLFLDERPLAGSIVLVHNGVMNLFVTSYECGKWYTMSPGTILHIRLMELAARSGLSEFDFSVGDESYKTEWAGGVNHISCSIFGLTVRGRIYAAISKTLLRLKTFLKSHDRLMQLLFFVNAQLGNDHRKLLGFEAVDEGGETIPVPGKLADVDAIPRVNKVGDYNYVQK